MNLVNAGTQYLNPNLVKVKGRIEISPTSIRIITNSDLCSYYLWLLNRYAPWIKLQRPKYGAHITIYLQRIHKCYININKVREFNNKVVDIYYDCSNFRLSKKNIWLPVICSEIQIIKTILGIRDSDSFLGDHLTIGNNKNL